MQATTCNQQPCNHMTKLIKFSWELLLKGCQIRLHYSNKKSKIMQDEQDVGNEETDFRIKNLLSWQNILSNRQIAADIEEKWANQGEVLRRGISLIYLFSSNKLKPCHGTINSRPRNLRTALEKYFRFQWNCKQLRIEARNSMEKTEIYFPNFSETIHIILKIFLQHDLRKVR